MPFGLCPSMSTSMQLDGLYQDPYPYRANTPLTTTFTGKINKDILQGSKITITASTSNIFGTLQVFRNIYDFCSLPGATCPYKATPDYSGAVTFTVPSQSSTDGQTVTFRVLLTNGDGSNVACVFDSNYVL
ncbi:UNVERIFIED_CONTAM: hypothetical protein HDU68_010428 [Siphonaria sp. JEL0065]|nr:hypothetical protein HDU68_010428 [Siphonaria sp. JEL0065]